MQTRTAPARVDLRVWYLPDWLYEAWPFIHLLGGGAIVAAFDDSAGLSSGLLLLAAGMMILAVRWWHRSDRSAPLASRPTVARRPVGVARSYYNDPEG